MQHAPAVVLAGGRSTRLGGGDKCLLTLDDRPILAHVCSRLRGQAVAIAINANGDPSRFARFALPVIPDSLPGFQGPLAGVLAGMRWAAWMGQSRVMTVAADTPFLPADLAARLETAAGPGVIATAQSGGRLHPVFALWPVGLADDLADWLRTQADRKIRTFMARHTIVPESFAAEPDPFFNINTLDDLANARRRAAQSAA